MLRQAIAISLVNLATLRARLGASLVVVVSIAGVVFVLTAMFAMANGLTQTLRSSGEPDRVLILGKGSHAEINGSITRDQAAIIANQAGIAATYRDDGRRVPLASPEIYASVNLPNRSGRLAGMPLRGVRDDAFRVRPKVRVTAGRAFEPGRFELLVGEGAARVFGGLDLGDEVRIKGASFRVVGHFTADGRAAESEAWLDVDVMANVYRRGPYLQSVLVRLDSPESLARLEASIDADRRLSNSLFRESDFYAVQSEASTRMMKFVGAAAGGIMALGALFAALNALYAAVSARTREIATLRALGFSATPVIASVLSESLALALCGGLAGAALGWLVFDGFKMASVGASYAQVAFHFTVTPALLLTGVGVAIAVGFAGGVFPAIRATRQSVAEGLRALV
jgi:putative ABC transport system permease protein